MMSNKDPTKNPRDEVRCCLHSCENTEDIIRFQGQKIMAMWCWFIFLLFLPCLTSY